MRIFLYLSLLLAFLSSDILSAQDYDEKYYESLEFRNIGPFRGGRSAAVAGVAGKPLLYYFGSTGGGVWRTKDGGQSWGNISDGHFGGSIGAVTVDQNNPNVIFVGGGEKTVRGNVSYGYGIWKTEDGGNNWMQLGLKDSRHISRIRIHPRNSDIVYAAVMGDLFKSSETRGVYRSKDGGKNWERILFANADAGAVDLVIDPNNPNKLFASTWRIRRTPYSLESGGEGSALWRSTDGGDTWENISEKPGLPKGTWGINAVAVSPVDGNRIYSIIENKNGGVFMSNDGGDSWRKTNSDRALRQRAWYYTRIYADPQDIDGVYVMNVNYHHSTDGGYTFERNNAPHGDHHDLWIAPEDPERMIIGDDGGAQVSFDRGENWSTYRNQPTSQFYRVTTDNHFPYRIYGAQQDNSTVRINHRSAGYYITDSDWESTAGGESAHIAVDPNNPEIVYGGSYGGFLTRYDHSTGQRRGINVWPDNPMGHGAEGMKYRFQWNFPIFFGADGKTLYTASNQLHRTRNEGQSWEIISPDLTRAEAEKLKSSGGPITQDNTSVEYYATIFAAAEDAGNPGTIWAASDDGLVHVTRDDGKNWENVTPPNAPKYTMWNSVRTDPFGSGKVYLAGTQYKLGDYKPYLFKSEDYGKSWARIDNGIPRDHFTRVLQPDHKRAGLLYAGTESGLYISFDDGKNWKPFQQNLPIVPITDLAWKNDNLIVATQGRSFWIMDDLTPLHQLNTATSSAKIKLFEPTPAYRMRGSGPNARASKTAGMNHAGGVTFHYYLDESVYADTTVGKFHIIDAKNDTIRTWSTAVSGKDELELEAGNHRLHWNLYYPGGTRVKGMILWWAGLGGPMALPGKYRAVLEYGDQVESTDFTVLGDQRSEASESDLKAQFDFMLSVRDKVSEAHQAIIDLRKVRGQINDFQSRLKDQDYRSSNAELEAATTYGDSIVERLTEVEKALYQTQNRSGQDPLNFPIRLTNKLAHLNSIAGIGNYRPTDQLYAVRDELSAAIDEELAKYRETLNEMIPAYNQMVREAKFDIIMIPKKEE